MSHVTGILDVRVMGVAGVRIVLLFLLSVTAHCEYLLTERIDDSWS